RRLSPDLRPGGREGLRGVHARARLRSALALAASEPYRPQKRLRPRPGVVRVDRERDDRWVLGFLAIHHAVILTHVPALGRPFSEICLAGSNHDERHRAGLLTRVNAARRQAGIPDIPDEA